MEAEFTAKTLFVKFSNAINVVRFYGYYGECKSLMRSLCTDSRMLWTENEHIFEQFIESHQKIIKFLRYFDQNTADFLLNQANKKFRENFLISIVLYQKTNIDSLCDFVAKVPRPDLLKFDKIYFFNVYYEDMELERITSLLKLSPCSNVIVTPHHLKIRSPEDMKSKIKYLTNYKENIAPYCEQFEKLRATRGSSLLSSAVVPVNRLQIEYSLLKLIFRSGGLQNDYLKEHVKSIDVYDIEHALEITPSEFVIECMKLYSKCREYSFSFFRCSKVEICSFLNLCDLRIAKLDATISNDLKLDGIAFTFSNRYMYFHGFRENSDSVMIKVKYARVLLTKKSCIMTPSCSSQHGSSIDKAACKIFVFDKPTVIDIKGVTKIGENHSEFIKMQEHIKIVKGAGLSLNRKFIAVFNNRFDSISITNCYKRAYPSLDGCKLVEFVFTSNHMSSHANMIKKYLTQLSDKTEVNLLINRNVHDLIKLMVDDFMKLKNLEILDFEKEFVLKLLDKSSLKELDLLFNTTIHNLNYEMRQSLKQFLEENVNWRLNTISFEKTPYYSIN